jgi:aminoglycoside phosphotransferase (APT) family kinase protein
VAAAETSVPTGIDVDAMSDWLVANVANVEPPLHFELITGGRSNLTFRVGDAAGRALAVRRPPLGHVLESAHDMGREFRVIDAVGSTDVPVPEALALCTDHAVAGADFYVMEFVEGIVPHDIELGASIPDADRRPLGLHAVDVLAQLHSVDPEEIGLGDLGRREDYIGRQLRRWSRQWDNSKQREIPQMERVVALLTDRAPEQQRTTIVHGDYRLGNMIVGDGRVRAVVDWELCTLGDPLADLGYMANQWLSPGEPTPWRATATQAGGFMSRSELITRYGELTGADLSRIGYYQAFQQWRMAAILEGVYARYRHGAMGDVPESVDLDELAAAVVRLADEALRQVAP